MKITDIRAIPLKRRLNTVYMGGTYRIDSRYTLVTEVELEDGTLARTFGGDEERYQKDVAAIVNDVFRGLLMGQKRYGSGTQLAGDVRHGGERLSEPGHPHARFQPTSPMDAGHRRG